MRERRPGAAPGRRDRHQGRADGRELQGDRHALAVSFRRPDRGDARLRLRRSRRFDPKRASIHQLAFANLGVYTFGAHCVEVDVDEGTGAVEVRRAWCAHDVGRAMNPVSCEGQIQGGFVQGMGYALTEEMHWNAEGWLTTVTLADYKMPGVLDTPAGDPCDRARGSGSHPSGRRQGRRRASLVGAAPAIANAICNATGARMRTLPMTPERVLDALEPPS